jgi:hypothetical protein
MDIVIGILLIIGGFLYTSYAFMTDGFVFDLKFYLQIGSAFAGSCYILWGPIMELFKSWQSTPDSVDEGEEDECMGYCNKDFEALMYLKKRAKDIESKEAKDLVIKLNNILFCGKDEK